MTNTWKYDTLALDLNPIWVRTKLDRQTKTRPNSELDQTYIFGLSASCGPRPYPAPRCPIAKRALKKDIPAPRHATLLLLIKLSRVHFGWIQSFIASMSSKNGLMTSSSISCINRKNIEYMIMKEKEKSGTWYFFSQTCVFNIFDVSHWWT